MTQLGFARISSHLLGVGCFGMDCEDRILQTDLIPGTAHVTDHYLAALARQHGLVLATFDFPLSRAFPEEPTLVELIPSA